MTKAEVAILDAVIEGLIQKAKDSGDPKIWQGASDLGNAVMNKVLELWASNGAK